MAVGGSGVLATRCVPEIRRGVTGGFVPGALAGDEEVGRFGGCISTGRIRLAAGPAFAGEAGLLPIEGDEGYTDLFAGGPPARGAGAVPDGETGI